MKPKNRFVTPALSGVACRTPFNNWAPLGGGGGGVPHHPPTHHCPPPLKYWAKFSAGPSADQNISLAPSAPIGFDQKLSLAPLKSQHHLGGGGGGGGWTHAPNPPGPRPPPPGVRTPSGPGIYRQPLAGPQPPAAAGHLFAHYVPTAGEGSGVFSVPATNFRWVHYRTIVHFLLFVVSGCRLRGGVHIFFRRVQGVLWELDFFFVKDRPQGPPQGTTNRQPPPTANRQPPPTANRHQPPTANRHQPWLNI